LLHIDTSYKFPEMTAFRDSYARQIGAELIVHKNQEALDAGTNPFLLGTQKCCGLLKTKSLLDALTEGGFDAAFGGARRDEEKSRAKERIYSFRDSLGQWDPKNQRPELWNIFNSRLDKGESIRVFPLSNWTELDVWLYIHVEQIPIVPLYFAREREVVLRSGSIVVINNSSQLLPGETTQTMKCRMRSLGCVPCTGAIRSEADTLPKIIEEMVSFRRSERENRTIDHDEEGSMELKKREGYF
jgi:sulfate adenylyltransferase subunit 2